MKNEYNDILKGYDFVTGTHFNEEEVKDIQHIITMRLFNISLVTILILFLIFCIYMIGYSIGRGLI